MFFPIQDPVWVDIRKMQDEMDALMPEFMCIQHELAGVPGCRRPLLEECQRGHNGHNSPGCQKGAQPNTQLPTQYRRPLMDIYETDKEIVSSLELPGVAKEDIKVSAAEDGVEIKVEKKAEKKEEDPKKGFYRMERSYAGFYRYVPMPKNADLSKLDASYKEGILELRVPKLEQKPAKREIKVN